MGSRPLGEADGGCSHGRWLVRNFLIHDKVSGRMLALERKEELQIAIEEQQEMGLDGLAEEDRYLLEINLEDLETTSGEHQAYCGYSQLKQQDWPFRYVASRQQGDAVGTTTDRDGYLLIQTLVLVLVQMI
jgi:hypothetical protein